MQKANFLKNTGKLAASTLIAQIVLIMTAPIITRLYTADSFGKVALIGSIGTFLSLLPTLRLDFAIPTSHSADDAKKLLSLSLLNIAIMTVLISLFLFVFKTEIFTLLKATEIINYWYVIPMLVFSISCLNLFRHYSIYKANFNRISASNLIQSLSKVSLQITLSTLETFGLLVGLITSSVLSLLTLTPKTNSYCKLDFDETKKLIATYKNYPKFSLPGTLINAFSPTTVITLITIFFSPAMAGLYALTNRVLTMPVNVVGRSLGQVYFSNAKKNYEKGDLNKVSLELVQFMLKISVPGLLFLFLYSETLFIFVFGDNWGQAGQIAKFIVPITLLQFIYSPLNSVFNVVKGLKSSLKLQVILTGLKLSGISIGIFYSNINIAFIMYSLLGAIGYILFLCSALQKLGIPLSLQLREILSALIKLTPIASAIFIISYFMPKNSYLAIFICSALLALHMSFILYLFYSDKNQSIES